MWNGFVEGKLLKTHIIFVDTVIRAKSTPILKLDNRRTFFNRIAIYLWKIGYSKVNE